MNYNSPKNVTTQWVEAYLFPEYFRYFTIFNKLSDIENFHLIFRSNYYDINKCGLKGISEMYRFRRSLNEVTII